MTTTAHDVLAGRAAWSAECSDAAAWLATLPDDSVHLCATSPPYFSLRDYGVAGQIGLHQTLDEYVASLVGVFRELRRVLHPSGVFWLNLGDSYVCSPRGNKPGSYSTSSLTNPWRQDKVSRGRLDKTKASGVKQKDLLGVPWKVAFALRDDGWYLRQHCPWVKRNSLPESVTDRPGTSCEEVFLFAKRPNYFFDMEAVRRESPCQP